MLSRRLDPRAGRQRGLGHGSSAGPRANVIPGAGTLGRHGADARRGRLERHARSGSAATSPRSSRRTASRPTVDYQRGVPPVVNDAASVALLGRAVDAVLGDGRSGADDAEPRRRGLRLVPRPASPGRWAGSAPATPGGPTYDIHQGNLRVDERATALGAKVLATVAVGSV